MAATAGYNGKIYTIDDSVAFSSSFTTESTTETGVTKLYTIDDSDKIPWDRNESITVAGYWAFQEFALDTTSGADSGLASTTQYYFKIAIDGGAAIEYDLTTGAGTVTWANLVTLIDAEITTAGATCQFIDGDIRIHSDDVTASSDIECSAGTTGTNLFGQGNVPTIASLETVDYTDIMIDTAGYGDSGINYSLGIVQMNYTGFTSLTVTGKYHSIEAVGQFTSYNITMNYNTADTTEFQTAWKKNVATTRNATVSIEHIYINENFFDLQANATLFFKIYIDYGNTVGYSFFGTLTQSLSATPHEVIRDSFSVDITGNLDYFTS